MCVSTPSMCPQSFIPNFKILLTQRNWIFKKVHLLKVFIFICSNHSIKEERTKVEFKLFWKFFVIEIFFVYSNHGTKEEDLNKILTEMALTRVKMKMMTYLSVWPQLWKGPGFKMRWTMPELTVYHPQLINNLEDFSTTGMILTKCSCDQIKTIIGFYTKRQDP